MRAVKVLVQEFFDSTHRHRIATTALAVFLIVEGVIAIGFRQNDFEWHRRLGDCFLEGDPYREGGQWYPPGRAMFDAGLAAMNKYAARSLVYCLSVGTLVAAAVGWNRLRGPCEPRRAPWTASLITAVLGLAVIQRDLDECGLQILLLGILTLGGIALQRGRPVTTGFWLAVAVTYKSTPILCLPFLLWKRQFRAAGWMVAFIVYLNTAPALYLGWDGMVWAHGQYLAQVHVISQLDDPSQNGVEDPKPQNQSVLAAGARYLMRFDSRHTAFVDHPAYLQFGALSGPDAKRVIQGMLLVVAGLLAWRFWPTPRNAADDAGQPSDFANQWAAVCALCALMAPLCWKQHLVLTLPCLLINVRGTLTGEGRSPLRLAILCLIGLIMLGSGRELIGATGSFLLSAYKVHTLAAVLSICLVLTMPRSTAVAMSRPVRRAPPRWHRWANRARAAAAAGEISRTEREPARHSAR